jgi:hypothetical protein
MARQETGRRKSRHFDFIRQDRQSGLFHGSVLRQLLGVIRGRSPAQDEPHGFDHHADIANAIAQSVFNQGLQRFFPRADRRCDHWKSHDRLPQYPIDGKPSWTGIIAFLRTRAETEQIRGAGNEETGKCESNPPPVRATSGDVPRRRGSVPEAFQTQGSARHALSFT